MRGRTVGAGHTGPDNHIRHHLLGSHMDVVDRLGSGQQGQPFVLSRFSQEQVKEEACYPAVAISDGRPAYGLGVQGQEHFVFAEPFGLGSATPSLFLLLNNKHGIKQIKDKVIYR
jgi:hypothetical protein